MALLFSTGGTPATPQSVGVFLPLKAPITVTTNEACTFSVVGALPIGLYIEEISPTSAAINGIPTRVEAVAALKIKAENLAQTEHVETTAFEIKVKKAIFKNKTGLPMEMKAVDKSSGEWLELAFAVGGTAETENEAEIRVLSNSDVSAVVERTN